MPYPIRSDCKIREDGCRQGCQCDHFARYQAQRQREDEHKQNNPDHVYRDCAAGQPGVIWFEHLGEESLSANPAVRLEVRHASRGTVWTDHRVDAHDFFTDSDRSWLTTAMATTENCWSPLPRSPLA